MAIDFDKLEKKYSDKPTTKKTPTTKKVVPKITPKTQTSPWSMAQTNYNMSLPGIGNQVAKNLTQKQKDEIAKATKEWLEKSPVQSGFMQGITPNNPLSTLSNKIDVPISEPDSAAYKASKIAGTIGQFAIPYGGASKGVGAVTAKVLPNLGKFGSKVAQSVATDAAVGLPLNVNYAYNKENLEGGEALKSIALNTGIDLIAGGVLEGLGYAIKLKSGKKVASKADFDGLAPKEKEEVLSMLPATKTEIPSQVTTAKAEGVFVDYYPEQRALDVINSKDYRTLVDEIGADPEELITVYRGAPSTQKAINDGDWVTISEQLAKDYSGGGNVIKQQIKAKHLYAPIDEGAEELIYSTRTTPQTSDVTVQPTLAQSGTTVPPAVKPIPKEGLYPDLNLAAGEEVRGMSKNVATDMNMRPEIVQSYRDTPDIYEVISNKESLGKAQNIFGQGYQPAYDNLMGAMASNTVKPEHIPLARMLANQAAQGGDVATARKIISDVSVKLTEAGQLSQAAKILRQSDPMAVVETIQKYINKINTEFGSRKGWKNFELLDSEIEDISKIDVGDTKAIEEAIHKVGERIAKDWKATGFEKFDEFRRVAMLLNPKTQIRNIVGNVPILLERKLANKTSGFFQQFIPADQRTQKMFVDENSKSIAKQLYDQNKEELLSTNKWDSADLRHIISSERKVFKNKGMEGARLLTYNLLQKGDVPFLKSAFIDRASSYIAAQGYKTLDDVPQKVINEAKQQALKATYRDSSTIATMINQYKRKGGIGGKAVEATLPFVTTPINLARRAVDYSPFGFIKILSSKDLPTMADKIDTMAQALVGTGVLGLGAYLAKNNIAVASPPENKDRALYQKSTGVLPFSIDTPIGSFTYDWAQPVGSQLAMGVEAYNAYKEAMESGGEFTFDDFVNAVGKSGYALGDTVLNTSVYQNIIDLFQGYGSPSEKLAQNLIDYPLQAIPTVLGQATRSIDPYVRTSYDPTSEQKSVIGSIKAKTPGLSNQLPVSVDVWGNDLKRVEQPGLRVAQEFLNPAQYTKNKVTEKDRIILDLFDETNSNKVFPSKAPYYIESDNQRYDFTPSERSQFQKTMGQYAQIKVDELIKSNKFKREKDPDKRVDMLDKIYVKARDAAKSEYLEKKGVE